MADMVLSPLVGMLIETLTSELIEKVRATGQVGDDLNTLSKTLKKIQCLLDDAEEVQITKKTVRDWLSELKDVAYDADDVLDELQYEAFRQIAEGDQANKGKGKRVLDFSPFSFFSRPGPISFRLAERIKIINERLATVFGDRNIFCLREDDGIRRVIKHDIERLPTSSVPTEKDFEFLGRDKDKEEIIKLLLSDDVRGGQQAYSVISIVGMGGLGKTTLAQHVYNDKRVEKHFEVRAWVCVSEEFDVLKITKDIIESAKGICHSSAIDPVQRDLEKILSAKRFLIVLDDVWNEERSPWDRLRGPFNAGAKGSKILVTTRNEAASRAMYPHHPYLMEPLASGDCFALFLQHAFAGERYSPDPELVGIGKDLVERHCQGLPLAAKVLGGLLNGRKELSFWKSIPNSQIWISGDNENEVMKVLRVSYHHLPPHVKQCFAFCSIFPKDYSFFSKDKLVGSWMAHGFIVPTKGMRETVTLEEKGCQCFDLLVQRSFFQRNDVLSSCYKMHDCIHDLAESLSNGECLRMERGTRTPTPNARLRHLSLLKAHTDSMGENLGAFKKCKSLRTLHIQEYYFRSWQAMLCQQAINDLIVNFKCLRVLIVYHTVIEELPDSISDLKHLRYLDLSYSRIKKLPETVSSLYHLQTLKLIGCTGLHSLPRETRKLINLRHLNFEVGHPFFRLTSMPSEMGRLTSLQTLPLFIVGRESGNKIEELKGLTQLRGCISIEKLQNISNAEEAKEARLKNKEHIQELELEWDEREEGAEMKPHDEAPLEKVGKILEALQPHKNLEYLCIRGYKGNIFPTWLQGKELPYLKHFTLFKCKNCTSLSPLGQRMTNLEEECEFEEGGGKFSRLQELLINDCPKLTKMSNYFSPVKTMSLSGCHQLTCPPICPSLDKLELWECNDILLQDWVPRLTSLSHLQIGEFKDLTSLPKGMLHPLSNLKDLEIWNCEKLESLESLVDDEDEGLPSTLVSLGIHNCNSLKTLGEKCLPATLQRLAIGCCSQLKIEDWAKISHIPSKAIDEEIIS